MDPDMDLPEHLAILQYGALHLNAGTTTATVLARAIYDESCKSAAAGIAPQDMRKGVQMGVDHVVARLKERAKMISTPEEIAQVHAGPLRCKCMTC
jgi:chaperonin GroEL (HSP60 family)